MILFLLKMTKFWGEKNKIGAKKAIYQIFELKKKVRAEGKKVTSRAELLGSDSSLVINYLINWR